MYALDNSSGVSVMPAIADQLSTGLFFTEGGDGQEPSYPGADWYNIVQSELIAVLTEAGISPNKTALNQLSTAIKKIIQKQSVSFATDTGAANAYVVSLTPALASPRGEGMVIRFKVANTNTGACTVNDGVSTVPIVGLALSALQGGEMVAGGDAWIQWHPYVGTGSYVLLYCSGAPMQVYNAAKSQQAVAMGQLTSVAGSARNLKCTVTAASATATFTADELVVETAPGGLKYQITGLNKLINLATTGAGGMDTGSAPVSGYVAIYAILNPTTGATALLGVNATSAVAPEVYSGSNLPVGYTASALISVLPTNSSSQFKPIEQLDRAVSFVPVTAVTSTLTSLTTTQVSVSSIIPKNAVAVSGWAQIANSSASFCSLFVSLSETLATVGSQIIGGYATAQGIFKNLKVTASQSFFYGISQGAGYSSVTTVAISGYTF